MKDKKFDAVKFMREQRRRLSEEYWENPSSFSEDLNQKFKHLIKSKSKRKNSKQKSTS